MIVEPILSRRSVETARGRLARLAPDQVTAGLEWLAAYHPRTFADLLDAAETWDSGAVPWERCCVTCGAQEGIMVAVGDDWRHYPRDRPPGPYEAGHPYITGWRLAIAS